MSWGGRKTLHAWIDSRLTWSLTLTHMNQLMPKHDDHYKENNKYFPFAAELQLQCLQSFDDKPFTNIYLLVCMT